MDATRLLERLCARHGLSVDEAQGLLPLVERALVSPLDVRERILCLIEANLARRAGGEGEATLEQLERDLDAEVLRAVATTLHGWEPTRRTLDFRADEPGDGAASDGELDLPGDLGI